MNFGKCLNRSRGLVEVLRLSSWACLALMLLPATNLRGFHGIVQTIEGARLEGEIRLEQNAFTITDTNGASQRIGIDQFIALRAAEQTKTDSAVPSTEQPNLRDTHLSTHD